MRNILLISQNHFYDEEKYYLNSIIRGLKDRSKGQIVEILEFARTAVEEGGEEMELVEGTLEKVNELTDEEWMELTAYMPFRTNYSFGSYDEVPEDE